MSGDSEARREAARRVADRYIARDGSALDGGPPVRAAGPMATAAASATVAVVQARHHRLLARFLANMPKGIVSGDIKAAEAQAALADLMGLADAASLRKAYEFRTPGESRKGSKPKAGAK